MGLHKGQTNKGSFKKGQPSWNKNLTKDNNKIVKKMSNTRKKLIKEGKIKVNPNKFIKGHKQLNSGRTHFKKGEHLGKEHPNWNNGSSFEPYSLNWRNTLKESIRQRDKHICQICSKKQNKRKFDVHHINYNKKDCNPDNLITLCITCHRKTNHNRKYWINYFKKLK